MVEMQNPYQVKRQKWLQDNQRHNFIFSLRENVLE